MIYDEPKYLPGGDRYLLIEFGNEMNLELNFMAQGLASAIVADGTKGVIETAPSFASMLIHYEPDEIGFADLKTEMARLIADLGPSDNIELESRLFYFPTVYLDPWTRECVQDYIAKIAPKTTDPEFVAELNGLSDVQQFVRVHSGTEYWVASLGFWPGLPFMMALDPRCKLTAPKYNPPRTWTPKGTVGMGGASTAIYPEALPGGYQIFGRIPVPIWDPNKRFDVFSDSICLFRPGDRVKFVPCTVEEFAEVERQVDAGTYQYNVAEYQKFSVAQYKSWVAKLDASKRF
jgi:urea carboxylase